MPTAHATVEISESGRLTVPEPARKKLGIDGESVLVDIEIEYRPGRHKIEDDG